MPSCVSKRPQQVTCRITFVSAALFPRGLIACAVGMVPTSILRRSASDLISFITGSEPYAPLPITRRRHFHGISSSTDRGECPNCSRNSFEGFFRRLRISPRLMTTSWSYGTPSISIQTNLISPHRAVIFPVALPRARCFRRLLKCSVVSLRSPALCSRARAARIAGRGHKARI